MPNGDDRNWIRLLSVCADYRTSFDEWPARVEVLPAIRDDLQWVLGSDAFDRLSSRLEVRANPAVDYLLAVGARGSVGYAGAGIISAAIRAETAAWLGEQPRPEIA